MTLSSMLRAHARSHLLAYHTHRHITIEHQRVLVGAATSERVTFDGWRKHRATRHRMRELMLHLYYMLFIFQKWALYTPTHPNSPALKKTHALGCYEI